VKEITFLKQNASKWEAYETVLNTPENQKPAVVTEMFIELTDDYSYAKTNYPESKTTRYLNMLTARIHQLVYRNKKESNRRILSFWGRELPRIMGNNQNLLLLAFAIAALTTLLGAVSQLYDDSFVRLILPDNYVDETIERIKAGNPIGIYGEDPNWYNFVRITSNNIRVSFTVFALGMFFSFGTVMSIAYNSIMLGSFFAMFYQYNVLDKALKVVWIHGTLEISAIIIAGCAGFILGRSFMFPGTYTRSESFKRGAKDGLKIIIGLIPVFICAGFLESFVTRYTEMPLWLSLIIILGSLAFILWYFVIFPILLTRTRYAATKN